MVLTVDIPEAIRQEVARQVKAKLGSQSAQAMSAAVRTKPVTSKTQVSPRPRSSSPPSDSEAENVYQEMMAEFDIGALEALLDPRPQVGPASEPAETTERVPCLGAQASIPVVSGRSSSLSEALTPSEITSVLAAAADPFEGIREELKQAEEMGIPDATEVLKRIQRRVRADDAKRKAKTPIPPSDLEKMRNVSDLSQYVFERTYKQKVLASAGQAPIPDEVKLMTYPEVVNWLVQWKKQQWANHLMQRGVELFRCPECDEFVKKEGHRCIKAVGTQLRYNRGVPTRATTIVKAQGNKVTTKKKREVDFDLAAQRYEEVRRMRRDQSRVDLPAEQSGMNVEEEAEPAVDLTSVRATRGEPAEQLEEEEEGPPTKERKTGAFSISAGGVLPESPRATNLLERATVGENDVPSWILGEEPPSPLKSFEAASSDPVPLATAAKAQRSPSSATLNF